MIKGGAENRERELTFAFRLSFLAQYFTHRYLFFFSCRYLVPADLTVGQFVYVIRKRIKLSPEKAIFVFINNQLPPTATLMSVIYEKQKDEDGFLYVTYSGENTFGTEE